MKNCFDQRTEVDGHRALQNGMQQGLEADTMIVAYKPSKKGSD